MEQVRVLLSLCNSRSETHLGIYKSLSCRLSGWQVTNTLISTTNLSFTAMATTSAVMLTPALIAGGVHLVSTQILRGTGLASTCQKQLKASSDYANLAREIRVFLRRQETKLEPPLPPPQGSPSQGMNQGMRPMNGGAGCGAPASTVGVDIAVFLADTRRTIAQLEESVKAI